MALNILYINNVDISGPTGPGTNERMFIQTFLSKSDHHFVITKKQRRSKQRIRHTRLLENYSDEFTSTYGRLRYMSNVLLEKLKGDSTLRNYKKLLNRNGAMDLVIMRVDNMRFVSFVDELIASQVPLAIRHFHKWLDGLNENKKHRLLKMLKYACYVDTTWRKMQQFLEAKHGIITEVKDNAIDLSLFPKVSGKGEFKKSLGFSSNHFVIGYIGGFPYERGGELIIKSAKKLLGINKDFRFVIIGDAKNKVAKGINEVKMLIKEHELEPYFFTKGYVPFDSVYNYFAALDVGVALVPYEVARDIGNSSQKIYQYLATGSIPMSPLDTHQSLETDGMAMSYHYKGVDEFSELIVKEYQNSKSDAEKCEERFNYVLNHKEINSSITQLLNRILALINA